MITKFNQYINESLTDKMTPIPDEEVRQNIINTTGVDKIRYINKYNLEKYFTKEEIDKIYNELPIIEMIDLAAEEDQYDLIKTIIKKQYHRKEEIIYDFDMSPLYEKITRAYDIIGVAFNWNQDEVLRLINVKYGITIPDENDIQIVTALELMDDADLVNLYSIMLDKINNFNNEFNESLVDKMKPKSKKEFSEIYKSKPLLKLIEDAGEKNNYQLIEYLIKDNYHRISELFNDFKNIPNSAQLLMTFDAIKVMGINNKGNFLKILKNIRDFSTFSLKIEQMTIWDCLEELMDDEVIILYNKLINKIINK